MDKCEHCGGCLVQETDRIDTWIKCILCSRIARYLNPMNGPNRLVRKRPIGSNVKLGWTLAMDNALYAGRAEGLTWQKIADAMHLSKTSVRRRAVQLGLIDTETGT